MRVPASLPLGTGTKKFNGDTLPGCGSNCQCQGVNIQSHVFFPEKRSAKAACREKPGSVDRRQEAA